MPALMWLFLTPLIAFGAAFLLPRKALHSFSLLMSLVPLLILIYGVSAPVNYSWFPALSIHFHLSVDSISLIFLYLTAIVIPFALLSYKGESHLFYALVFILEALLFGFFSARDLFLFTFFWEGMLLPLYFMINIWGGPNRKMAAMKFLIYMIAGSALLVAAVLSLYFNEGTFDLDRLAGVPYTAWVAFIFFLAFAVKTPLFPFHGWLPDAYFEASTAGTILLSAILSKAGIYGFVRIGTELFPAQMAAWSPTLLAFAITGVFWGAFSAWMQRDYKRLIAYSSFSHVNFILVGLFVWNQTAEVGSILQAFNHGVTITALFLVADWLEIRLGTTTMNPFSGLAKYLPKLCWITLFFVLSSVALPGMNNFVGELLILFGLYVKSPWLAAFLGTIVIFSVVYMLRWMQKVYFENPCPPQSSFVDIKAKEILIALPLVFLILWVGLYPSPLLSPIDQVTKAITR
jgi:NADH-quinone oxidoreductase subunit M